MITIYKNKKDIPQDMEYIELNDVYFNQKTASILDERAERLLKRQMVPCGLENIRSDQDLTIS